MGSLIVSPQLSPAMNAGNTPPTNPGLNATLQPQLSPAMNAGNTTCFVTAAERSPGRN